MSNPYGRIHNFSAGPCTLPVEVLEQARDGLLNYQGTGMSVMEMSHRSKPFEAIIAAAEADLRALLGVPEGYKVLFLQGGASLQFSMLAMNFLPAGSKAEYVVTGTWGQKALESGKLVGNAVETFSGAADKFRDVPASYDIDLDGEAAYVHITSNETIQGVRFVEDPITQAPLFCDMSSDILSRPVAVDNYAMIYAGAQKNMGPAGLTVVILSDEQLAKVPSGLSPMLDYRVQADNGSMYNTPPCWSIYMAGLVYKHLLLTGGLKEAEARNIAKSSLLYGVIDESESFYTGHAVPSARSIMNVTFTLRSEDLTKAFLKGAEENGLDGLKGHRSVGGCRASIYNAFTLESCEVLAEYMREFARANG